MEPEFTRVSIGIPGIVVLCVVFNMILYIKMIKRRTVLFVCLFPGMLLLFLIGKYGHLLAE